MIGLLLTNYKALFLNVKAVPSISMDANHQLVNEIIGRKKPEYITWQIEDIHYIRRISSKS